MELLHEAVQRAGLLSTLTQIDMGVHDCVLVRQHRSKMVRTVSVEGVVGTQVFSNRRVVAANDRRGGSQALQKQGTGADIEILNSN